MKRNGERRKRRSEGRRMLLYSLSVVLAVLCLLRAVTPPAIRSAATVVHAEARAGTCEALATSLDPTLRSLVTKPFFRYFKVALDCNCTLFGDSERGADSGMCGLSHCAIGLCSSSELPPGIKHWSGDVDTTGVSDSCCDWDDSDCEWTHDDESASGPGIAVVDLTKNPEGDTGYVGEQPRHVWRHLHSACCSSGIESLCKLASGLHSSISLHIARSRGSLSGARDTDMFRSALLSEPERISNMYFAFAFVARAVKAAAPALENAKYGTGSNSLVDWRTNKLVRELVRKVESSGTPDKLEGMLVGTNERKLRETFRYGVYKMMDCVTCDRCRLWGKLQSLGMATAMKCAIAADHQSMNLTSVGAEAGSHEASCPTLANQLKLGRLEAVALVNLFARLTDSVQETQIFLGACEDEDDGVGISTLQAPHFGHKKDGSQLVDQILNSR